MSCTGLETMFAGAALDRAYAMHDQPCPCETGGQCPYVPTETPVLDRHDKPYPTLDPPLTNPRLDRRALTVAALAAAILVSAHAAKTTAATAALAAYKTAHP